jgi:hypothetical protein
VGYITKLKRKEKKTLDRLSSEDRTSTQLEFIPIFFWTNFHHFVRKKGPTTSTNDFFGKK